MQPEIDLFGLPLKTFGLMFALGFLACGAVIARRLRELGKPVDWAYEMIFAALVGGLVGSRLYWIIENSDEVERRPARRLFGGSGLVWYGGVIGGAVARAAVGAVARLARRRGCSTCARRAAGARLRDRARSAASSPATATTARPGTARGRWPTRRHRADRPSDGPPDADLRDARDGADRVAAVGAARPRAPGLPVRAATSCSPALERFLVEFLRRNDDVALGLTPPQLESLAMIAAGLRSGSCAAPRRRRRAAGAAALRSGAPAPRRPQAAAAAPARKRSAQACSSASCWIERWWPPGTTTSGCPGRAACSSRECSTGTISSPSACRSSSALAERGGRGVERRARPAARSSAATSAAEVEAPGAQAAAQALARSPGRSRRPPPRPTRSRRGERQAAAHARAAQRRRGPAGEQRARSSRRRRPRGRRARPRCRRGRAGRSTTAAMPVRARAARAKSKWFSLRESGAVQDHDAARAARRRARRARRRGRRGRPISAGGSTLVSGAHGVA